MEEPHTLPDTIKSLEERLESLTTDMAAMKAHADDEIIVGSRASSDPMEALGAALDALPQFVMQDRRVPLGAYRGLRLGIVLHPQWRPKVYLEGAITRQDSLSREHQGPRGVLNALERLAKGYGSERDRLRQDLSIAETQLRRLRGAGRPAVPARRLQGPAHLFTRPAQGRTVRGGAAGGAPTIAELAGRIKELQASNSVEAARERTGTRRVSAEEPVTARIKRRAEVHAVQEVACVPTALVDNAAVENDRTAAAMRC